MYINIPKMEELTPSMQARETERVLREMQIKVNTELEDLRRTTTERLNQLEAMINA